MKCRGMYGAIVQISRYLFGRGLCVAAYAGVEVHVVATVRVGCLASFGAFEWEAGFDGDAAGGVVAGGVAQVQPVEAGLIEGPGADGC